MSHPLGRTQVSTTDSAQDQGTKPAEKNFVDLLVFLANIIHIDSNDKSFGFSIKILLGEPDVCKGKDSM